MTKHQSSNSPIWFKVLNFSFLLPILVWPLVFFATIFIFDNPSNLFLAFLLFATINAYPIYLIVLMVINRWVYRKNRLLGTLFPLAFGITFVFYALSFFGGFQGVSDLIKQIKAEPKPTINYDNVIGFNYKKDSLGLYYGDQLLKGADVESFELISFHWARDKQQVYYLGKSVATIDSKTFKRLGNGYNKDKNFVYLDTSIVQEADPNTFYIISGTKFGRDSSNCFEGRVLIDCSKVITNNE